MYVRTQRRRRTTLGDDGFFSWGSPSTYGSPAWYWANVQNALAWSPGLVNNNAIPVASAPPTDWSILPSLIPGSSPGDYVDNAIAGKPTQSQLDYNANQYIQAAANMASVLTSQGVPLPPELDPATVVAQAASDQGAYANLIGGTADAPNAPSITTWAWIALAGVVGLIVITR